LCLSKAERLAAGVVLLAALLTTPAIAQEKPVSPTGAAAPQHTGQHPGREKEKFPEIEAVFSDDFRSVSYFQPLVRRLNFEGHYFDVDGINVGTAGASWAFRLGEHVTLSPGMAVYFGEQQTTAPAISFRWEIEKGWIVSQGLFIQALRESEEFGRPNIFDGNHVSVRWRRLEVGPCWERIHTREENEWKGGGRAALRILRHLSAVMFVLGPDTEVRGGIIIHPARHEK
jgi:hypothetical protein